MHRRRLRDLAPEGVCAPPNPWVYEQLARLCSDDVPDAEQPQLARLEARLEAPPYREPDPDVDAYVWDREDADRDHHHRNRGCCCADD